MLYVSTNPRPYIVVASLQKRGLEGIEFDTVEEAREYVAHENAIDRQFGVSIGRTIIKGAVVSQV